MNPAAPAFQQQKPPPTTMSNGYHGDAPTQAGAGWSSTPQDQLEPVVTSPISYQQAVPVRFSRVYAV